MLGDKLVFGRYTLTVDNKNRMTLPSAINAEPGQGIIIYAENGSKYIVDKNSFTKMLSDINDRIFNSTSVEERKENLELLDYLASKIILDVTVDNQHRIRVTGIEELRGKVEVIAEGRLIKILESKESKYKQNKKELNS